MALFKSSRKLEIDIAKRVTEACDLILSEIGAELHDDLIQKLTVFRLLIDSLENASSKRAEVEAIAVKMESEFAQVVLTIKNISRQLLPTPNEGETFIDRIDTLCQNMQSAGITRIHFQNEGMCHALSPTIEKHLFRIIQELINNAFKHSSAWHIWIRLTWKSKKMILEVEDDGSGFSKKTEYINRLKKKYNTLKMRTNIINATISYHQGERGLIARLELDYTEVNNQLGLTN